MKTSDKVHELFLNYACNAKCPFCYNPPITPELLRLELSFEQAAQSLYSGAKGGARRLNIHGGEVTLRDDLPKILRLARKLGFTQITVVTNGIRLAQAAYARSLAAAGATHFRLSIHAADAPTHDAILAIPGAFGKALAALKNLGEMRVPIGLNFVLIKSNYRSLPGFVERFRLEDIIVYFPHLRGMMAINAQSAGVSYEEVAPFVRQACARAPSLLLANFIPCVLPDLADRMLDWSHEPGGESSMTHPEGFTEDIREMKDEQRIPVKACRACVHGAHCLGVEKEYLARRGEAEFLALNPVEARR